jgi:hypothetical protein
MAETVFDVGRFLNSFAIFGPCRRTCASTLRLNCCPNSLQLSWQANKPSLGKFGQCAAAFDSKTDDAKMAFACSVYVKLTAVAERKAIQHCDEQRVARQIKAPCQLVR